MYISELIDEIWREVSVGCCSSDLDLADDVADECIVSGVLERGLSVLEGFSATVFVLSPHRPRLAAALRPARVYSMISSRWSSSNAAVM